MNRMLSIASDVHLLNTVFDPVYETLDSDSHPVIEGSDNAQLKFAHFVVRTCSGVGMSGITWKLNARMVISMYERLRAAGAEVVKAKTTVEALTRIHNKAILTLAEHHAQCLSRYISMGYINAPGVYKNFADNSKQILIKGIADPEWAVIKILSHADLNIN